MGLYRDRGIVLRTIKLGEADRIVTFLTEGRGKVRAVAKGVRKTKSRFGGRLEPPSHVAALFYEGRSLDIVTQADTLDHFRALRDDLGRLGRAANLLEAADQLSQEEQANPRLYAMLLGALRALAAHDSAVLVGAFFLKALALEGFRPELDACVACGADGPLVGFDAGEGGVLCRRCARRGHISPQALDLMRRVLGGALSAALAEPPSPATWEVEHVATRALEHHLERRLRSVGLLERS